MIVAYLAGLALASSAIAVPRCAPAPDRVSRPPAATARARPLSEMPPAREALTVLREADGCPVLLIGENGRIVEELVGRPDRRRVFRP
jgi:hypothetical protein